MKLIDCVTFFDNNFIFEIRYNILKNYVDHFIVCESKYDHKGFEKPKNFILKDLKQFKPNKDLLTKLISEKSVESLEEDTLLPPQWNPDIHKSYMDYMNSKEYREYLIKKQEQ